LKPLPSISAEDVRVEFGAGEKSEKDGPIPASVLPRAPERRKLGADGDGENAPRGHATMISDKAVEIRNYSTQGSR